MTTKKLSLPNNMTPKNNSKKTLCLLCLGLFVSTLSAQSFKLGNVSKHELALTADPVFKDAGAVVLSRQVENRLGRYIDVYERIKIYTPEGYDRATIQIPYTDVEKVKGYTYNLVDGEIEKTKLDKDFIFDDEVVEGVEFKKFTFPKVTSGSVIELYYRATRGTLADLSMQYAIPIRDMDIVIRNESHRNYNILQNPKAFLKVTRETDNTKTIIRATDVPALQEESYVYDMDEYRAKLEFASTGSIYGSKINSFEDIGRLLMKTDDFKRAFKSRHGFNSLLGDILKDAKDDREKAKIIYQWVHDKIKWNEYYGIYPDNSSSRETFTKRKGDLADINLLYLALLRAAKIEAHPALASTRSNGLPLTPSYRSFNYLMVSVMIDGAPYLVDAAHTEARFDRLPEAVINYMALVIYDDGKVVWEEIKEPAHSDEQVMVSLEIDDDLLIAGKAKERYTGYNAFEYASYLKNSSDRSLERIADYALDGFEADAIEVTHDSIRNNVDVTYTFEIEDAIEEIGNQLYLKPLLFLAGDENPFLQEERKFPIFFGYPKRYRYNVTIQLPDGYNLKTLPTPIRLELPDQIGTFMYTISYNQPRNSVQLQSLYQINRSQVNPASYFDVKEFFKQMLEKEQEQIVLIKT
ncbi:MAG: hypothetical protein CL867_00240 [Cytophagaceae bacterium]|nr:hypothetical protein [Cytophagaceae bacterium]